MIYYAIIRLVTCIKEVQYMEVKIKGVYRHFKGEFYIVEDIAYDSETLKKMVIYRALYNDNKLWIRPYTMFVEEVNKNNQKHRFELIDLQESVKLDI